MKTIPLFILCVFAVGCTDEKNQAKLAAIEARNNELKTETVALRHDVDQLNADKKDRLGAAVLSGTGKGFELAQTEYGSFPISLVNAVPYLDGYKLTLGIGNPLAANVTAGTISVRLPLTQTSVAGTLSSVSQDIVQPIVSGNWTNVDVIVAPAKADQLGYIVVVLTPTGLSLSRPK